MRGLRVGKNMNMSDTLTQRAVKNSIYSLIGFVWPLLLSFVAAPVIITGLGSARFGFYALLNSALALFGMLDFGLSYTFAKHLSENRENRGGRELAVVFSSTVILYAILGAAVMLLFLLLPGAFRSLFKIPDGFISSYGLAFFILGATFFIKMLVVPLALISYSLQRQDIATKISLINNILLQVGSIVALKTGHGILSLLVIQLISAAFLLLSNYFAWHLLAPELKFVYVLSKKVVKTIGQQGFWVFITNTTGTILAQLDKSVLGIIWGPTAVGYYSTAQMIPEKISATSFSLSQMFFPIFSEASSQDREGGSRVKAIFRRSMGIIPVITAGLTVLVVLYGYQLVRFWVNRDFADFTAVSVPLLAVTYFFLSFGQFFHAFLSGLNALKFLALISITVAIIDVVFMFVLIPRYSVNGASWAYLLSSLPMPVFLYFIERKYFSSGNKEIAVFYGKLSGKIFLVGGLTFFLAWFVFRPFAGNLALVLALGGLTFALYLLLYWVFGFYAVEDQVLAKIYAGRLVSYFKKTI